MGIFDKFKRVCKLFIKSGFSGVLEQTVAYLNHHTKEKWRFIYLELDLTENPYSLPDMKESLSVRLAKAEDIEKIKTDLYPHMAKKQEYDKRYIESLGEGDVECFVAEKEGKFVSYFMIFKKAAQSPLMQTPFNKKMILGTDAYLGNVFTIPNVRGMWIVPHVLLSVIGYLQEETTANRAILLVHEDTPGAVSFFKRLGFKLVENATSEGFFQRFFEKTN